MRNYTRFVLPAAVAVVLFLGPDLFQVRSAGAAAPSTPQDVNIVSPLTTNGSVPVEATIKGIVRTRVNPALTHVGVLASDVVTLRCCDFGTMTEVRFDGSTSRRPIGQGPGPYGRRVGSSGNPRGLCGFFDSNHQPLQPDLVPGGGQV